MKCVKAVVAASFVLSLASTALAQSPAGAWELTVDTPQGANTSTLNLKQDAYIEKVPVPAAMQTQMGPTLRLLRTVDRHARLALLDANKKDLQGFMTEIKAIDRLVPLLNKRLDRAGLRDCGSNQA